MDLFPQQIKKVRRLLRMEFTTKIIRTRCRPILLMMFTLKMCLVKQDRSTQQAIQIFQRPRRRWSDKNGIGLTIRVIWTTIWRQILLCKVPWASLTTISRRPTISPLLSTAFFPNRQWIEKIAAVSFTKKSCNFTLQSVKVKQRVTTLTYYLRTRSNLIRKPSNSASKKKTTTSYSTWTTVLTWARGATTIPLQIWVCTASRCQ